MSKARKEAAVSSAKAVGEAIKGLVGQSSKDKEIKALQSDLDRERELSREDGRIYTSPFLFFSMTIWKRNQYDR